MKVLVDLQCRGYTLTTTYEDADKLAPGQLVVCHLHFAWPDLTVGTDKIPEDGALRVVVESDIAGWLVDKLQGKPARRLNYDTLEFRAGRWANDALPDVIVTLP
jgi:hypothetical protein